ncbi:DUF2235 domain-containing protein [Massilia sp. IC2-278]|uniref:RHS repeat-associated core domain-containing protein n=1 Tax=Massilia sp. IC2-278 TaxID=2887200 RepID=UPI001E3DD9E4|nr:RHS repeat-associated core domain-containing protein [Massilia sp. IC2-278]MCC2961297.1 DUF2235 domain-containing protein [Massilia sp. IC2-278]
MTDPTTPMTRFPLPASMLRAALMSAALATLASPAQAEIPGFPITPDCPPNSSCVPSTPPVTPPGTCGPGPGGATCGAGGPAASGSATGINVGAGNPVNIINGNKYGREVDMPALPGVLGLEIVRHYNSAYSGPNGSTNLLGRGWKLSYETDLYITPATLQVVQADGSRIIFSRDPRQPSLCASGDPADGSIEIIRRTRQEEYVWTMADGRKLSFDTRGKLVQVRHPGGEFLTLGYDRGGLLLSVTDPQGRSLRLNYRSRSSNAFAGVESIDSPLGRFTYRHGGTPPKGATVGARDLLANLAGVRYPGNAGGRDYHYEDTLRPTYLTGISLLDGQGAQRYATYRYNADGKAVFTSHAGNSGKVELDFSAPGRTTLTNSLGQKTVYRHAVLAGQYRLLEVRGPGCADCGETNLRYSYDEAGRLLETTKLDRNGQPLRGLRTEYDARSRPLRIRQFAYVNGKPARAELVTRYEYGQFDSPTLIVRPSVVAGKEAVTRIAYNDAAQPLSISEHGWAPHAGDQAGAAVPIVRTTRYGYRTVNGRSLLARIDGPLPNGPKATPADSDITEIEWDGKGNAPLALTRPGMLRSSVEYDALWRIAGVRSDSGAATRYGYDARGRRSTVTSGGIAWQTRFDVLDRIAETGYTKDGAYTATSRRGADLGGLNVWSVNRDGQWQRQLFDTEGRLRETGLRAGARAQVRQYAYDEANRLSAVSDAEGGVRRIVWNAADQAEARIDALGRVQRYRYDGSGQLAEVIDAANTWQAQATQIERDALGITTAVTAANGARTRYTTDDFGRTLRIDSPDSGAATRRYDEAGRLVATGDALGNRAEYRYDAAGRIVRQSVSGPGMARPQVTSWIYEGALLVAVEHPVQGERYAYDAKGRLLQKTVTLQRPGGAPLVSSVRYGYGADGQTESVTLADGSLLQVKRDAMNAVVGLERQRIVTPWLRWMLPAERLAHGIRRDLADISGFEYGNGIRARFERSAAGALARVAYERGPGTAQAPGAGHAPAAASASLARRFGIAPAHAASAQPAAPLALRFDTQAVLDYRYLWDVQGNLLRLAAAGGVRDHAYDAHDRLIVEARRDTAAGLRQVALDGAAEARYFYDKGGNRILGQEGATLRTAYAPDSNRWLGQPGAQGAVQYDANGQPRSAGKRSYGWDALGKLVSVREGARLLAEYRYNHRGERVAKRTGDQQRFYLYSGRRLNAELDAEGRVLREYVYLAGRPLAVIDSEDGVDPATPASAFVQALRDVGTAFRNWFGIAGQSVTYLHTNHLGAPEAATDGDGKAVWKVRYAAFGAVTADERVRSAFRQPLRLPGQVEDEETGLYYNDHRYYDPRTGRYLSPDPLGLHAAANAYAYVDSNPLKYVDPEGLVLFAFDGTGNTQDANWLRENQSSLSNVALFQRAYSDNSRYISGVGTVDTSDPSRPIRPGDYVPWYIPLSDEKADMGANYSGRARIERMVEYFRMEADLAADNEIMEIDIIGFSRGAAQARDFANRIVANTTNGWYRYTTIENGATVTHCQRVNFRFMGLWDTVLSTDWGSGPDYQLGIPDQFAYVAQAVALNEFRGQTLRDLSGSVGAFPLESILGNRAPENKTRIELGFIGAHADIGGGFASDQNDLAKVALNWMLNQAVKAGVPVSTSTAPIKADPVLHDKSDNQFTGAPTASEEDRQVRYTNGRTSTQRNMSGAGMEFGDTGQFISYLPGTADAEGNLVRTPRADYVTGNVNMPAYLEWLKQHGYDLTLTVQ